MKSKVCPKCKATQIYDRFIDAGLKKVRVCHECSASIPEEHKPLTPYIPMDKYGKSKKFGGNN